MTPEETAYLRGPRQMRVAALVACAMLQVPLFLVGPFPAFQVYEAVGYSVIGAVMAVAAWRV